MAKVKFIHAADIHLDSPLRGLSKYEGVPADQVRMATRTALDNLVAFAIDEAVDFVVIAGDLYDGNWEDFGTGLFFCGCMGRLHRAGIDVYLLYGNHDAESVLTRRLPLPENVHVFGHKRPETFTHEATGVALHGQSYRERDTTANLAAAYPASVSGSFNIGVLHTALAGGRPPHAPYAPCTPAELVARGYDYWALGHVHDFEIVATAPHIVFPGNLQGRNIRETGAKGAVLVTLEGREIQAVDHVPLDAVRWARVSVDVSDHEHDEAVFQSIKKGIGEAYDADADGRPQMLRVVLSGVTPLHGKLSDRFATLRDEVRALATAVSDTIWVEKVKLETTEPATEHFDVSLGADLGQLLEQGIGDQELIDALKLDYTDLITRLPTELGDESDVLKAVRAADLTGVLEQAATSLKSRLTGAGA
jgi:exonuclease SbcD